MRIFRYLVILLLILLFCCEEEEGPIITKIKPMTRAINLTSFMLNVYGSNFNDNSKIMFNEVEMSTNFVNTETLECNITQEIISSIMNKSSQEDAKQVSLYIKNGDYKSEDFEFTVTKNPTFATTYFNLDTISSSGSKFIDITSGSPGEVFIIIAHKYPHNPQDLDSENDSEICFIKYYVKSSFSDDILLIHNDYSDIDWPVIRYSPNGILYSLWCIRTYDTTSENYIIKASLLDSLDKGDSWSDNKTIFQYKQPWWLSNTHTNVHIDTNSKLHILLDEEDGFTSKRNFYYMYSNDNGLTFSDPLFTFYVYGFCEGTPSADSGHSLITTNSGKIIYFLNGIFGLVEHSSIDNGKTWNDPKYHYFDERDYWDYGASCRYVYLFKDNSNTLYCLYNRYKNADDASLWIMYSQDNGNSWNEPHQIMLPGSKYGDDYDCCVDVNGNINIVYFSNTRNSSYFIRSLDYGITWSDPIRIINDWISLNKITTDDECNIFIVSEHFNSWALSGSYH